LEPAQDLRSAVQPADALKELEPRRSRQLDHGAANRDQHSIKTLSSGHRGKPPRPLEPVFRMPLEGDLAGAERLAVAALEGDETVLHVFEAASVEALIEAGRQLAAATRTRIRKPLGLTVARR